VNNITFYNKVKPLLSTHVFTWFNADDVLPITRNCTRVYRMELFTKLNYEWLMH